MYPCTDTSPEYPLSSGQMPVPEQRGGKFVIALCDDFSVAKQQTSACSAVNLASS